MSQITHITTRDDTSLGSPSVTVLSAHSSREDARHYAGNRANVLPVWDGPLGGPRRRVPKAGDRCGTFRDGRKLYAVGPEAGSSHNPCPEAS